MIISVFNSDSPQPERYSFTQKLIILGRNPPAECSVTINSQTISRNHLKARVTSDVIQIMDLNSSNGTFLHGQQIEPNSWITITSDDKIKVAEFQGYVTFATREVNISKTTLPADKKCIKRQSSQGSEEERFRSRDKQPNRELPFKISQSTLKMLKDMTVNRKSKEEKVKFLKLMGIGKAEDYWQEIQEFLKQKKGIKDSKKTNEDLQRQFSAARNGNQKRGLGK